MLPALTGAAGFRPWVPDHMTSSPASHSQLEVLTTVTTLLSKLRNVGFFSFPLFSFKKIVCVPMCVCINIYMHIVMTELCPLKIHVFQPYPQHLTM